ncbi:hypothetical protein MUK42_02521 [Musa troglodytarum]|uniref:Uncharacterized protein n=1 Tax=Musa troglodytarum TaxID=320322 RepID=A0A9E7L0H7_9LILI|nr:hypothetical protein MUK42_02521 [Musa troglodytarum]
MGRGRGKGKKLTAATGNEDPGSGDQEVLPVYKRRGRPQKPLKDDIDVDDTETVEEGKDDTKLTAPNKELKGSTVVVGKKRKRYSKAKENDDAIIEENGVGSKSRNEDLTRSNGFRHSGSRRKSKPRRAAEAGVECNSVLTFCI